MCRRSQTRRPAWVDASATVDRKIRALRCHPSQFTVDEAFEQRIREWAIEEGAAIGVPAAEAFRLIVIDDDDDDRALPAE